MTDALRLDFGDPVPFPKEGWHYDERGQLLGLCRGGVLLAYDAPEIWGGCASKGVPSTDAPAPALQEQEQCCGAQLPSTDVPAPALQELDKFCGVKCPALGGLPDPKPEEENPAALFKRGWLRKGGGAFLIAPSGVGKSTFTIQAATLWAMGLPAFGIEPVKPLTVAIIQAEDDDEEMADFRNQIMDGLEEVCGIDRDQIRDALENRVLLPRVVGAVGESFISAVETVLDQHPEIDLLIINPFQSYFGGDVSRNAELSAFLRTGLDPLIKPARAGVLFVHHTNKPPNAKDRSGWGTDTFAAYVGAGGAEIVNWSRAALALMPVESLPGAFQLTAGKRGKRLGWTDPDGNPTNSQLIAHSDGRIFWREATTDEVATVGNKRAGKGGKGDPEKDAGQLAESLRTQAASYADARALAYEMFQRTRGRTAFDYLKDRPEKYFLSTVRAEEKGCMFIGVEPEATALARAFDERVRNSGKRKRGLPT